MADANEKKLISQALAKDPQALEQLMFLRYDWLSAEARSKIPANLQGLIEPSDIVQEAFLRIFTSFSRFEPRGEGALFQWMRQITQNVAVDHIRKLSRTPLPTSAAGDANQLNSFFEDLEMEDITVTSVARGKELHRAFYIAMEKLDPLYRQTIELLYLEGKELEEVAKILHKSPAAVRGLRQRARQKLKELIHRLSLYV